MVKGSESVTLLLIKDENVNAMTAELSFIKQHIVNKTVRAYDEIEV